MPVNDDQRSTRAQKIKRKKNSGESVSQDVRLFPIWLRLIMLFTALIFVLLTGVLVGYSVVGNGKMVDALKPSTWTHIRELVSKEK